MRAPWNRPGRVAPLLLAAAAILGTARPAAGTIAGLADVERFYGDLLHALAAGGR